MKKTLGWMGIILFFVIAALIVIPAFMNWSSYKNMITTKIQEVTKLDVDINGKIKLRLLPTPALAVQKVHIKAPQNCREGDFLTLESIETHLSLASLITGKINLSSIHLIKPHVTLDTSDKCHYPFLSQTSLGSSNTQIKLSSLHIDEGDFDIYEGSNEKVKLKDLSFEASFEELTGPYALQGNGKYQGHDVDIDIKIGKLAIDKTPAIIEAHLGEDHVIVKGVANLLSGKPRFTGNFTAKLMDEDGLFGKFHKTLPKPLQDHINLEAQLYLSAESAGITDLKFDWHKIHGTGKASATFDKKPQIVAELDLQPLSLDEYTETKGMNFKTTSFFRQAYAADPVTPTLPKNFDLTLTLKADTVTFADNVLKKNDLILTLKEGTLAIQDVDISLPFGGKLEADMVFAPDWAYRGSLSLNLPTLHPYLAANNIEPPSGLLKNFSLISHFEGNNLAFNYNKMTMTVDNTTITGAGQLRLSDFGLAAKINIDRLNLNPYLILASVETKPKLIRATFSETAFPPLNIEINCNQLTLNDMALEKTHASFIFENDQLNFSNLSTTLSNGLTIESTGKLTGISQDIKVEAQGTVKGDLDDIGDVKATAFLKGKVDHVNTNGSFFIYGASGQFEGSFNPLDPFKEIQGTLKVSHPEAGFLFGDEQGMGAFSFETQLVTEQKLMNLTQLRGAVGRLILSGNASIDFNPDRPFVNANLDLGNIKLSQLPEHKPRLIPATVRTSEKPFSQEPFNLYFWNVFDGQFTFTAREFALQNIPFSNLYIKAALKNGHMKSNQLSAKLFRGDLTGKVGFVMRDTPQLTGSFQLQNLDVKRAQDFFGASTKLTGLLDADLVIQGAGKTPYTLMSKMKGQANLNIDHAVIHGLDLNNIQRQLASYDELIDLVGLMATIKSGGQTPLYKASGTFFIESGQATTDNSVIKCKGGTGYIRGGINLPEKSLDMQAEFKLAGNSSFPNLNARFHGPWSAPHTDFDTSKLKSFVFSKGLLNADKSKKVSKGAKILKNILGDSVDIPQPDESFSGKELVTDLLQGLF